MILAYLLLIKNACALFIWQLLHIFDKNPLNILRNILLLIFIPICVLFIHIHWFFFIIDECVFFAYRKTNIKRPLFIIGVPRSGTTYLQRTLAKDTQFTSTTLADCLFTPSITQRYLAKGILFLFSPLLKHRNKFIPKFFNNMQDIHSLGLNEPEEDFFMLTSILSCFIQMTIFPNYPKTWKLSNFDDQVSDWEKNIIMNFYKKMVQKHVFFYGTDKTYLAKNPSFTTWIQALHQHFDQPVIIACVRDPQKTIPSQISSLAPIFKLTGHNIGDPIFLNNIQTMLFGYYTYIEAQSALSFHSKNRIHIVDMNEIKSQLYFCIQQIYLLGQYHLNDELQDYFLNESEKNKQFKSNHQYIKKATRTQPMHDFQNIWPLTMRARLINKRQHNG